MAFEKFFLFWVPMNIQKDRNVKLESAYSFMLKYSKITVCAHMKLSSGFENLHPLYSKNCKKKSKTDSQGK